MLLLKCLVFKTIVVIGFHQHLLILLYDALEVLIEHREILQYAYLLDAVCFLRPLCELSLTLSSLTLYYVLLVRLTAAYPNINNCVLHNY